MVGAGDASASKNIQMGMDSVAQHSESEKNIYAHINLNIKVVFADVTIDYPPLKAVYIFFDTATYDEIERDVKVTLLRNIIVGHSG